MNPRFFPILIASLALRVGVAGAATTPHYRLRYDAARERIAVTLCLPVAQTQVRFLADDEAPKFVSTPERSSGQAIVRDDDGWIAQDWRAGECLDYAADLGRIADRHRRGDGWRQGGDLISAPQLWLLQVADAGPAQADVELPNGYALSVPWKAEDATRGHARYRIPNTPNDWEAAIAVGRFAEERIPLPGGVLRVALLNGADAEQQAKLRTWLAHVSRAILDAYGRLPLAEVQVLVIPVASRRGDAVVFGQSTRGEGHALTLFVDPSKPLADFKDDWIAVHELSHLMHPYLGDSGSWLAEGLASYYQNVLRARAGLLTPAEAWDRLSGGFQRGRADIDPRLTLQQVSEDMGERHDFMRVYWSGAAYWLGVDAELRRASGGKLSVDVALDRFDACCLPSYRRWQPADFVTKLDALLGTHVFVPRYRVYRDLRVFPDTVPLYAALGIREQANGDLAFDDHAPAAQVRIAIMARR